MMQKRSKKSLSQQVADEIYERIISANILQVGDKLPNENELSAELGISRTTLREAIRFLVARGILEVQRGKGTFIAQDAKTVHDFGFRNLDRVRIGLKDLYEMRLMFEPQVTALACRRATDQELERIFEIGEHVESIIRNCGDRTEADQAFHRAIVVASHNDFMIRLIPLINRAVSDSIFLSTNGETLAENTLRDHALIMEFLKIRDEGGARNAMSIHIHHAIQTLGLNPDDEPIL